MKSIQLIIFFLIHISIYAQKDSSVIEEVILKPHIKETQDTSELKMVYIDDTELFVSFPGGEKKLKKYLTEKINFENFKNTKNAIIVVSFMVDEHGKVDEVKIKGLEKEKLEKELSQVFYNMKRWTWDKKLKKTERKKVYKVITLKLDQKE